MTTRHDATSERMHTHYANNSNGTVDDRRGVKAAAVSAVRDNILREMGRSCCPSNVFVSRLHALYSGRQSRHFCCSVFLVGEDGSRNKIGLHIYIEWTYI